MWENPELYRVCDCNGSLTFHRIRIIIPSSRTPATIAEMMIHSGSSYGTSTPSTGSMSTVNYRKGGESQVIIIIIITITAVIIFITHHVGLCVHFEGWLICNELQCGVTSDQNSQSVGIVLQTHAASQHFQKESQGLKPSFSCLICTKLVEAISEYNITQILYITNSFWQK